MRRHKFVDPSSGLVSKVLAVLALFPASLSADDAETTLQVHDLRTQVVQIDGGARQVRSAEPGRVGGFVCSITEIQPAGEADQGPVRPDISELPEVHSSMSSLARGYLLGFDYPRHTHGWNGSLTPNSDSFPSHTEP